MTWYITYTTAYFIFMFSVAIYYFTKIKTFDDYLIAGWNMGFWNITGTIISTWCGAAVFIGWVGMGFSVGMSGYFKFALPGILVSMLLIYFFSKPLRRQRLYTLADLFSERFGYKAGILPSIFSAIVYSIPTTALQIVGMSRRSQVPSATLLKGGGLNDQVQHMTHQVRCCHDSLLSPTHC